MVRFRARSHPLFLRDSRSRQAGTETDLSKAVASPPMENKLLALPRLVESLATGKNKDFGSSPRWVSSLASFFPESTRHNVALAVDLSDFRLQRASGKGTIVSEAMCLALDLLYKKDSVGCDELLRVCSDISRYDPLVHNAKVFNLLSRLRQMVPQDLRFHVRGARLCKRGLARGSISGMPKFSALLRQTAEWQVFTRSRRGRRKHSSRPENTGSRTRVRVENTRGAETLEPRGFLEAATGKSKSTVNRLILNWLQKGILKKTGKARNTRYVLVSQEDPYETLSPIAMAFSQSPSYSSSRLRLRPRS